MKMKETRRNKTLADREAFAVRLRALRKEAGLTQQQLADKLGTKRTSITNWETGARFPDVKHALSLARVFTVPVDYLYGLTKHRYNIKVPDYFELDTTKLNDKGIRALFEYYKMLLESKKYTEK